MNLRKIIREEISKILGEVDSPTPGNTDTTGLGSAIGGTLSDIETSLDTDYDNMAKMIKTQTIDTKNKDNEIKANLLLKSKLDQNTPHRKGLEIEIPQLQKDLEKRKKQLKDLETTQQGIQDAKAEIEKQKQDLETQSSAQTSAQKTVQSVLPTLQSPI